MCIFPIEINGSRITTPTVNVRERHTILRKAILDGEIPITMLIGLVLNSPGNTSFISAIDRDHSCQESMIAVAPNVSNIILMGDMGEVVDIEEKVGVITTGSARWKNKGVYRRRPTSPEQHMFTTIEPMSVKFFAHKVAGHHSMTENAVVIGDNTYFPLNIVHTLIDYVRVLLLAGDAIEVRYYNGMTPGLFLDIWNVAQN